MASNLLLNGCAQALLSLIKLVIPFCCNFFLKLTFLGQYSILSNTFSKSSNFVMCGFFVWVKNKRPSIIASQYFLFCKHSRIAFMYDFHLAGYIFNPINIHWYRYEALPKYGNNFINLFEFAESLSKWNACFTSKIGNNSHLKLLNIKNVSLCKGYARLFLAILTFKFLKISYLSFALGNLPTDQHDWAWICYWVVDSWNFYLYMTEL